MYNFNQLLCLSYFHQRVCYCRLNLDTYKVQMLFRITTNRLKNKKGGLTSKINPFVIPFGYQTH